MKIIKTSIKKGFTNFQPKSGGYYPDPENKEKPHVVVITLNNGMTAFSEVFPNFYTADMGHFSLTEDTYRNQTVDSYIIPLSEIPVIFDRFAGMSADEIVSMLGGSLTKTSKKSKVGKMKKERYQGEEIHHLSESLMEHYAKVLTPIVQKLTSDSNPYVDTDEVIECYRNENPNDDIDWEFLYNSIIMGVEKMGILVFNPNHSTYDEVGVSKSTKKMKKSDDFYYKKLEEIDGILKEIRGKYTDNSMVKDILRDIDKELDRVFTGPEPDWDYIDDKLDDLVYYVDEKDIKKCIIASEKIREICDYLYDDGSFGASAKKSKDKIGKRHISYFGGEVQFDVPDTIDCGGGTLRYSDDGDGIVYEGKVDGAYVIVAFWGVSGTKGEELDVFIGNSKSELEYEGLIDPITGTEGTFDISEIPEYVNYAIKWCRDRNYIRPNSKNSSAKKSKVAKDYHKTWLDDDYVVCCKSNDPVLSIVLEEEHYVYPTEEEARAEGIRLYQSGEYKDIELYYGKKKLVGADEWAGMTKSRKVSKDMDVEGVFDDYYQESHGKYCLHLKLNGDSFYPKYFSNKEYFDREVQRAIDNGYEESSHSNYTDNDGMFHRHFWKDNWGKSTKKSKKSIKKFEPEMTCTYCGQEVKPSSDPAGAYVSYCNYCDRPLEEGEVDYGYPDDAFVGMTVAEVLDEIEFSSCTVYENGEPVAKFGFNDYESEDGDKYLNAKIVSYDIRNVEGWMVGDIEIEPTIGKAKNYTPDYKDFGSMLKSMRDTKDNRNVFKE